MNITLNVDEEIVKRASRIAARKNKTLPVMVEEYLTSLADEDVANRREAVARLEESIRLHSRDMGPRAWTRDDLYDRPKRYS